MRSIVYVNITYLLIMFKLLSFFKIINLHRLEQSDDENFFKRFEKETFLYNCLLR